MQAFDEESFQDVSFNTGTWKRIFRLMGPLKLNVIFVVALAMLAALMDAAYPLINRYGIDTIIETGDIGLLPWFIGAYVVYMVVIGALIFAFIYFAEKIRNHTAYLIRRHAFEKLQELPFSYYDRTPAGWIMARMTSDSRQLSELLSWGLFDLTWGGLMMITLLVVMFILNVELALITISVLPVLIGLSIYFRKRILKTYRKIRKQNSRITGAFSEGISGAKTTKTLVLEESNYRDFDRLTSDMKRHSIKAALFAGLYLPSILFVAAIATGLIYYFGGLRVADEVITIGLLYVFASYVMQFFEPVMQLANVLARIQQAQASAERVVSLIDAVPEIKDSSEVEAVYGTISNPKKANWEPLKGDVTFENVSFTYKKGERVLDDFSLEVRSGESIALVGHTGAGKSTIVNLICRFYEPTEGRILIDGRDYKDRSLSWLHANLGYVLQDPHLFSGNILENIRYGRLEATDEEVYEASRIVGADAFIRKFPNGYQTEVNEGGARLSVGEKQLISFARALLADPSILILDEATSSVDTTTEEKIQHAIETVMEGRTSFVIAHRLSTIVRADRILVLEHGKIIEEGDHETLIKQRGQYYELYTNQFGN
ncbi:MAG: ABC transporter ATP-binding protein [Bacillota bacterium]